MKLFKKNKQQEVAEQSRSEGKSVLLQTYITSLVSLILCVSMFMGTSYAWFTSEINNSGNEISVGILKAGIYKTIEGEPTPLTGEGNSPKLLDSNIRWEPGYTAVETFEIRNDGDLAFKYDLSFTYPETKVIDETEMTPDKIAKYFDVCLYEGESNSLPGSYEEMRAEGSGWKHLGTLEELLAGKPILKDKVMVTVRDKNAAVINEDTTDGVAKADTYKIAIHMSEDANNELMGKKLVLNVKLVAYQMPSEKDSFGNSTYDNVANDVDALQDALTAGDAVMISDLLFMSAEDCVSMSHGKLNGNYKKITYFGDEGAETPVAVVTTSGGTITNLTVDGRTRGGALLVTTLNEKTTLNENLSVSGCTFSGVYAVNMNATTADDQTVGFNDCTFKGAVQLRGNTKLSDCKFEEATLDVSQLGVGETITLEDCTYNGQAIDQLTLTKNSETDSVTISPAESGFAVVDGKLVLATSNVDEG